MHTKLTKKTKIAIAIATAVPALALGAGAAATLVHQGPPLFSAAVDSAPAPGVATFTHHKNGWRLTAAPLPGVRGGYELRLRDLAPGEVKGIALDLPVTGAVLSANGAPFLTFQPLRGGDLYAVLPPRILAPGSQVSVEVFSGASSSGSVGLAGLLH